MSGHGWVVPLPSGAKARCGGPALCKACSLEKAASEMKLMDVVQLRAEVDASKAQVHALALRVATMQKAADQLGQCYLNALNAIAARERADAELLEALDSFRTTVGHRGERELRLALAVERWATAKGVPVGSWAPEKGGGG